MPVALGELVTFRGDGHDGFGSIPRVGQVVGVLLPDGTADSMPHANAWRHSGGYCFEHRVETGDRLVRPTLPYYTIATKGHDWGICECQLVAAQLPLF